MMRRLIVSLTLAAAAIASQAAHLAPEQALQAAIGGGGDALRMPAADYQLAASCCAPGGDEIAMYIFTRAGGFIIASADDAAPALLAYGEGEFDTENIPANVGWWLDQCALCVERAAIPGSAAYQQPQRAPREPIDPICKTRWNQTYPFNNDCPMLGGQRAVTGCVATAMAQAMKVHNWPVTGIGSHSYTFKYNGEEHTESFNFGATTFRWSEMSNSANGGSTSEQRAAVAKLMHACGVACNMGYSPSGSGAYTIIAAAGMIKYLDYDKGMRMLRREWYSAAQWDEIIYSELAEGRAVMYAGDDSEVGHEFVCDGYSAAGFYHINWGWGGYYDGYFLLSNLYPEGQGTGGGAGNQGYNYNQEIVVGIQPPVEGSELVPSVALQSPLCLPGPTVPRDAWHDVAIKGVGYTWNGWTWAEGYTNYTLADCDIVMGVKLVDAEGAESFIEAYTANPGVWGGMDPMRFPAESFPVGEYEVVPVCRTAASGWQDVHCDIDYSAASLRFVVTDEEISIAYGSFVRDVTVRYAGFEGAEGWEQGFYPGRSYDVTFSVTSNVAASCELRAAVIAPSGATVCDSEPVEVIFDEQGEKTESWPLTLPADLPVGTYYLAVVDADGSTLADPKPIAVVDEPLIIAGIVTDIDRDDTDTPLLYRGADNTVGMTVICNLDWCGEVTLRLLKRNSTTGKYTNAATLGSRELALTHGQKCDVEWVCTPQVNNGTYYLALAYVDESGVTQTSTPVKVKVTKTTGIEAVEAPGDDITAPLYDLQGRPASANPTPGIYISPAGKTLKK